MGCLNKKIILGHIKKKKKIDNPSRRSVLLCPTGKNKTTLTHGEETKINKFVSESQRDTKERWIEKLEQWYEGKSSGHTPHKKKKKKNNFFFVFLFFNMLFHVVVV